MYAARSALVLVFLMAPLAMSCGEPTASTFSSERVAGPSFNFSSGPSNPGIVVRSEVDVGLPIFDFQRRLFALVHSANDRLPFCSGFEVLVLADLQEIVRDPSAGEEPNADPVVQLLHANDFNAFVYDITGVADPFNDVFTCEFIAGPRIAEGKARLVLNDNDFFAFLRDEAPRMNSFGWRANGTLEDQLNGGEVHFSGHVRIAFRAPNPAVVVEDRITLTPDPRE